MLKRNSEKRFNGKCGIQDDGKIGCPQGFEPRYADPESNDIRRRILTFAQ